MTRREVKRLLRETEREMRTAKGCDLIRLEEMKTDLETILCRK